mgnify:CR=1 FL=1
MTLPQIEWPKSARFTPESLIAASDANTARSVAVTSLRLPLKVPKAVRRADKITTS